MLKVVKFMSKYRISVKTYKKRIEKVKEELKERNLDAIVLMNSQNIAYMSGFFHVSTERPIDLIIPVEGEPTLLIPKLEEVQAKEMVPWIEDIEVSYFDTPGMPNFLTKLARAFRDRGLGGKRLGTDGVGWFLDPAIAEKFRKELGRAEFEGAGDLIMNMRIIKSEEELNLMRQCAVWGHLTISLVHDYAAPGLSPYELYVKASQEASNAMLGALGPEGSAKAFMANRPPDGYCAFPVHLRLRVGPRWYYPHWMYFPPQPSRKLMVGDIIKAEGEPAIGGYMIEHSRMMFLGEPEEKHKKRFEVHLKAKLAAFNAVKPGVRACDVDRACNKVFKDAGMSSWLAHHTGHGVGLGEHGHPWIDEGDETILRPGMTFSIEPGLFIKEEDIMYHNHETVVVTEDGCEWLSTYPRDLESCIIRV